MRKLNISLLPLLVLCTLVAVVFFGWQTREEIKDLQGQYERQLTAEPQKSKPRLSIMPAGNNPRLGPDSARVKMIAFVDYECGYCRKFVQEQLPLLEAEYIEAGKLQVIFRDFPLRFHKHAADLAQKAHASYHGGNFDHFLKEVWDYNPHLDSLALAAKFPPPKPNAAPYHSINEEIAGSKLLAGAAGITATPTVIINDRMLVGLRKIEELRTLIDYSMNNRIPRDRPGGSCAQ